MSKVVLNNLNKLFEVKNGTNVKAVNDFNLNLEEGEILEQGDHDFLLKNKGFYFDIFKKQQLDSN